MKEKIYALLVVIFGLFPIKKKKVFFLSYYGNQYGCNPKYLSDYWKKNFCDWTIVWGFTQPEKYGIEGIKKVRYLSWRYFYELCTSRVLVTNYRMTKIFRKRKGQLYIQTWHSSLRLKMIEGDTEQTLEPYYVEMAKKDSAQIDVLLSGCQYSTEIFRRAFWYSGPIIPTGTPRVDLLYSNDVDKRQSILKRLGLTTDDRVVMYAPTFRKDNSLECYNIDYRRLVDSLSIRFGGKWQVLLRLHPHLQNYSERLVKKEIILNDVTNYDDIQELLYISDCVISDYSSLVFDYSLTERPCFLYASDLKEYSSKDRALYFNIHELPFQLSTNNDELNNQIIAYDENIYRRKLQSFHQIIGSYETGHACQNVLDYIIKNIE